MRRVVVLAVICCLVALPSLAIEKSPTVKQPVKEWQPSDRAVVGEGFETSVPPSGWTLHSTNASSTWGQDDYNPHSGTYDALVPYDFSQEEVLYTGAVTATTSLAVSVWSAGSSYWCRDSYDNCDLAVYVDLDTTWDNGNETLVYELETDWPTDAFVWTHSLIDLDAYADGTTRHLAFVYTGNDGADAVLDDVEIFIDEEPPTPTDCTECAGTQYDATGMPVTINSNATFTNTVNVADAGTVSDVSVCMTLSHTWPDDLDITLTSPAGTVVELMTDIGSMYDLTSSLVCFHPNAADPITTFDSSQIPASGCYRPEGDLTTLDGESITGGWILSVTDDATGDQGTLHGWWLCLGGAAAEADLGLTKVCDATGPVLVGNDVTFTFTATNAGPGDAVNAVVTDTLPAGMTYVSDTCGGAMVGGTWTWTVGALAMGAQAQCQVTVNLDGTSTGALTNLAACSCAASDPEGDTASAQLMVQQMTAIPTAGAAGLTILVLLLAAAGVIALRRVG